MPTKRNRVTHAPKTPLPAVALYYASDGLWGDDGQPKTTESSVYQYPTVRPAKCREVWLAVRDELLPRWVKQFPGTRPSWWYLFDPECPRISQEDIQRHGWQGQYFLPLIPDLRKRIAGIGDPAYEHLALVPTFDCTVPTTFVTPFDEEYYNGRRVDIRGNRIGTEFHEGNFQGRAIDPNNPPQYESEAAYLKRHGLLTPIESRRLRKRDFEPEIVLE